MDTSESVMYWDLATRKLITWRIKYFNFKGTVQSQKKKSFIIHCLAIIHMSWYDVKLVINSP